MLFVIFLLLFSGFTYSQDSGTPAVELTFYTVNVQGLAYYEPSVKCTISSMGLGKSINILFNA